MQLARSLRFLPFFGLAILTAQTSLVDDPRGALRSEVAAYFESAQSARSIRLHEKMRLHEAGRRYYASIAPHGTPLCTLSATTLAETESVNIRLVVKRTVALDFVDQWTRELEDGKWEQKWLVTETYEEPSSMLDMKVWIERRESFPLLFRGSVTGDGTLALRPADPGPVWAKKHFLLLGPFTDILLPGDRQ